VSLCVSLLSLLSNGSVKCIPPFVARQRLGKYVPAATNKRNSRRIVERVIFYAVLWACLYISLSLLGIKSVKTFPRQRRNVGGVVFYVVHVVSKQSRRLVLPRTHCFPFCWKICNPTQRSDFYVFV
jgi:hypothetical protein